MKKHFLFALFICAFFTSIMSITSSTNIISPNETQKNVTFQTEGNETTPKSGGTLRMGVQPTHFSWLPHFLVFNGLVRVNESLQLVSDLAESWNVSSNGLTYSFALFSNVTWHDGCEFNASDVKFSYEFFMDYPNMLVYPNSVKHIGSIEIVDRFIVKIQFTSSYAPFLSQGGTAWLIAKHIYENGDPSSAYDWNSNPMGTGPFKFVQKSESNITLNANDEYFRGRPYLDTVIYKQYADSELPSALENNEIDMIPFSVLPTRISEIQTIPGLAVGFAKNIGFFSLGPNNVRSPFNVRNVRKAISLAINRSRIIDEAFLGYADAGLSPISPALSYWYNSSIVEQYNTTLSEKLLDDAGYPRNPTTGIRFNTSLKVGNWDTVRIQAAMIIRDCLGFVGINVSIEVKSLSGIVQEVFNNRDFDMYLGGFEETSIDPDQSYIWNSHETGQYNYVGCNNTQIDALLEQGVLTVNNTARKEIYNQFQGIIAEEVPMIVLYYRKQVYAFNNDFHDFVGMDGSYFVGMAYSIEKVWYDPTLSGQGKSPVKVCFIDQQGRRTGWFNGSILEQIPNSTYDEELNVVKIRSPPETKIIIRNPDEPYRKIITIVPSYFVVEVVGTDTGDYRLELVNVALEYKSVVIIEGDTWAGKVDRYWLIVWDNGMIFQHYGPPYRQRTIGLGFQMIIPSEDVDPEAYSARGGTIIPR